MMSTVVERACAVARAEKAARVTEINVVCGAMSGVVPEALTFCFDVCVAGTAAAGAALRIRATRGKEFQIESVTVE